MKDTKAKGVGSLRKKKKVKSAAKNEPDALNDMKVKGNSNLNELKEVPTGESSVSRKTESELKKEDEERVKKVSKTLYRVAL